MGNSSKENRLNELSPQEWLPFTKTWFIHNPAKRSSKEVLHPAKYPEDLVEKFICFFTKTGEVVFDPFLGTGSTVIAAERVGRKGIGIELQKKYVDITKERLKSEHLKSEPITSGLIIQGDSQKINSLWKKHHLPEIGLVITSPPYGPMLNKTGLISRDRTEKGLDVNYSDDPEDLGNALTYDIFLQKLTNIFLNLKPKVKEGGHIVVILQNYMHKGEYKMLAWDFAREMSKHFQFRGEKIWCQDNKTLYPYVYRYSFVPNVHHHYCLIFKKIKST